MADVVNDIPQEPKVQLFNVDTGQEIFEDDPESVIDYGEVKAGDQSDIIKLRFWNNMSGDAVCSTMRDSEIFVLDSNKGKTNPLVTEGWLHTKCTTAGNSTFTRLNDKNSLKIKASGLEDGMIEGGINDGNPEGEQGKKNYADLETYIQIIDNVLTASHGDKPFYIALRYYFT